MLQTLTDVDGTLLGSSQADGSARTSGVMEEEKPQQIVLLNYVTDDLAKLVTVYNPGPARRSLALLSRVPLCTTLGSDHGARAKNQQIKLLHCMVEILCLECLYAPRVSHKSRYYIDPLVH